MGLLFSLPAYLLGGFLLISFLGFILSVSPKVLLRELLSDEVLFAVKLTLTTSSVATLIVVPLSVVVAYSLARFEYPLLRLVKVVVDLPMAFPELLVGFLLLVLFSDLLDPVLGDLSPVFTPAGVVIAQMAVALPFAVRVLYTGFVQLDPRYEMVARSLGYGPFETFLKVSLPMVKAALLSALVVAFARSFGAFGAVLIFGGGVHMKTETLPVGIYLNLSYGNLERAVAMGALLMAVSFLTVLLLELFQKKGVHRFGGS